MVDKVLFSSRSAEWNTPFSLFKEYDSIYHFDTDPCTQQDNPLNCKYFYTKETDGLKHDWIGNVFVNPPYGNVIYDWVKYSNYQYWKNPDRFIVMLLPARTDTKWFHQYFYSEYDCKPYSHIIIKFLRGRLKFERYTSVFHFVDGYNIAPFPTMIVTFKKQDKPF